MASIIGAVRMIKYMKQKRKRNRKPMRCYTQRQENLWHCGYASYQEYLKTEEWFQIRKDRLQRYPECILCDQKATQVHHLDYEDDTLMGMNPKSLVTICDSCHELIEMEGKEKRTLERANEILFHRASQVGKDKWAKWKAQFIQNRMRKSKQKAQEREEKREQLRQRRDKRKLPNWCIQLERWLKNKNADLIYDKKLDIAEIHSRQTREKAMVVNGKHQTVFIVSSSYQIKIENLEEIKGIAKKHCPKLKLFKDK